jgi:hypothetical protein
MIDDMNWLMRTLASDERTWTPDERTQMVARCNQVLYYCTIEGHTEPEVSHGSCQEALAILLRLRDAKATELAQRTYSKDQKTAWRYEMMFVKARAPHTIPFLAGFLSLDPEHDTPVRVEDMVYPPRASTSARTINQILRYSPHFSEDTRRKASETRQRITVEIMRRWWQANEAQILEERYDLVTAPIEPKEANNTSEGIRQPADGSPKPSR